MRSKRKPYFLTSLVLLLLLSVQSAAAGQVDSGSSNDHAGNSIGAPTIKTGVGRTGPTQVTAEVAGWQDGQTLTGPGAPAWLQHCRYETLTGAEVIDTLLADVGADAGISRPDDPEDLWGALFCPGRPDVTILGLLGAWPLTETPPQIVLDVLNARARAAIELPLQIGQGAPFGSQDIPLITQLPTWLWIDPAVWAPRRATPPPVFGVTITATATPVHVVFANNAGDTIDCGPNNGPPYNFNLKDSQQHSDCTLTYRHSTAIGDHTLNTTITWQVTYTCTCGNTGTLEPFTIATTRPVRVAELQAIAIPTPPNN